MMPKKTPGKIKELVVIATYLTVLLLFANYEANRKASFSKSSPVIAGPDFRPSHASTQPDIFRSFIEQSH